MTRRPWSPWPDISAMKSSNFAGRRGRVTQRGEATRGDATRSRRGSLPFGLIARQWLRPLGTDVVMHSRRALAGCARSPGADVVAYTTQCCCTLSRLARTWCNYSPQFRVPLSVTVTLRLCPPNARCIQLAHYALHLTSLLVSCSNEARSYALAHAASFYFSFYFVLTFSRPVIPVSGK